MVDIAEVWGQALPEVRKGVAGVGVWAALNTCKPVTFESGTLVLGLPAKEVELSGHLRMPQTRRLIEERVGKLLNEKVTLRVIEGVTQRDWETEKKRDEEKRRLQERALERARKELQARTSWESIYDQLSRRYSVTPNRTLPQNRAKFFLEAIAILAEALQDTPITDELAERNYARCIERIAQYTEIPSALVALKVLERSFEG